MHLTNPPGNAPFGAGEGRSSVMARLTTKQARIFEPLQHPSPAGHVAPRSPSARPPTFAPLPVDMSARFRMSTRHTTEYARSLSQVESPYNRECVEHQKLRSAPRPPARHFPHRSPSICPLAFAGRLAIQPGMRRTPELTCEGASILPARPRQVQFFVLRLLPFVPLALVPSEHARLRGRSPGDSSPEYATGASPLNALILARASLAL